MSMKAMKRLDIIIRPEKLEKFRCRVEKPHRLIPLVTRCILGIILQREYHQEKDPPLFCESKTL